MSDIWVISDTHFFHENSIKWANRPFADAKEMNDHMVTLWNETVKDGDKVYHLGDVYMGGSPEEVQKLLSSLKGQKRLILGNHDNGKDQILQRAFKKVGLWRMWPEYGLLFTHVPVHPSTLGEGRFEGHKMINVHGHIHTNPSPDGPYQCVCVEQIGFKPVNIEDLRMK